MSSGGLGIIDPKAQFEALLAKLLVRGLAPGREPWKESLRHRADQVHLPVHNKGPNISDINWLFTAPKFKQTKCSFWKSILGCWLDVRVSLAKSKPTSHVEVLRQPIFNNPPILNTTDLPLGVCVFREGRAIDNSGCTRIKDLWDSEGRAWKSLQAFRMTYHATNMNNREIIIVSIPWNLATYTNRFKAGDWISKRVSGNNIALAWVYHVIGVTPNTVQAVEFQRVTPISLIKVANSSQVITFSPKGYHPIKVLSQERHGAPLRVAKELPSLTKPPLLWIFKSSFIDGLPWDPGEWHWQASSQMGDSPFFGYSVKRGYQNARKPTQSANICSFIQRLNLQNSTVTQVIARI